MPFNLMQFVTPLQAQPDPNGGVGNAIRGFGLLSQRQQGDAQLKQQADQFEREKQRLSTNDVWSRQKDIVSALDKYNDILATQPELAPIYESELRAMGVQFHPVDQQAGVGGATAVPKQGAAAPTEHVLTPEEYKSQKLTPDLVGKTVGGEEPTPPEMQQPKQAKGGKPIPPGLRGFMAAQATAAPETSDMPSADEQAASAARVRAIGGTPETPSAPVDPNVAPPDEIASALRKPMSPAEFRAAGSPTPVMPYKAPAAAFDEAGFQDWYAKKAKLLGINPNPDDPAHHYDMRAFYAAMRAGRFPDVGAKGGHFPSEFKTAGHPRELLLDANGREFNTKTATYTDDGSAVPEKLLNGKTTEPAAASPRPVVKAPETPEGQAATVALQAQGIRPALPAYRASFNGIDLGTFDPEASRARLKREAQETGAGYAATTVEKYRPLITALANAGHSPEEIHEMMKTFGSPEVLHLIGADAAMRAAGAKRAAGSPGEELSEYKDGRASVREMLSSSENPGLQDDIKSVKYLPKLLESLRHPRNGMDASFTVREIMLALNKGAFSDKDAAAYMTDVSVWDKLKNMASRQANSSISKEMLDQIAGAVEHKLELSHDNVGSAYRALVDSNQYERATPQFRRGRRLAAQQMFGGTEFYKDSDWSEGGGGGDEPAPKQPQGAAPAQSKKEAAVKKPVFLQ